MTLCLSQKQIEHRVLICSVSLDTEWGSNEIRKESKPASEATEDVTKMEDDKMYFSSRSSSIMEKTDITK